MVRRREASLAARSLAAGLALVLASATLDLHSGLHPEMQLTGAEGSERHLAAAHPEQPQHVEAASGTVSPHCLACLRQLRSGDRLATPRTASIPLAPQPGAWHLRTEALADAQRRSPISRGPPAA